MIRSIHYLKGERGTMKKDVQTPKSAEHLKSKLEHFKHGALIIDADSQQKVVPPTTEGDYIIVNICPYSSSTCFRFRFFNWSGF